MADPTLIERAPLAPQARPARLGRLGGAPGVVLGEVVGRTLTLLLARKTTAADAGRLAAPFGLTLPPTPTMARADGFVVLWAGPAQWLVVAEARAKAQAERLVQACAPACMVVDQSDARAIISVSGPKARQTLAKGFTIDLHPRAFKAGDVALTTAAGIGATIWQDDDTPSFTLAVARSYADGFWHWLTDAAAEYGCEVVEDASRSR